MDKILLSNKLPKTGMPTPAPMWPGMMRPGWSRKSREFEALLLQQMIAAMEPRRVCSDRDLGVRTSRALFRRNWPRSWPKK